jgi:cytoskeletal protein RodZ
MERGIGEILASERRRLGKTLYDVEAATKIRTARLDALEKEDWDRLPDPAYVKGYIIAYAKFLELDPRPLVEQFRKETGERTASEQVIPREQVVAPRQQINMLPWRTALIIVAALAVIVLVIWGIGRLIAGPEEPLPIPNSPETTETAQPSVDETPPGVTATQTVPGGTVEETTVPTGQPFTVRIEVDAGTASWLRITVDDLKAYEGIVTGPVTKEYDVTDTAIIRIGKVTAVTVYRDGEEVEMPAGEIPEITLTAE